MRDRTTVAVAIALGTTLATAGAARAQAELFAPGVIATEANDDLTPTFAPDGSRLVFARRAEGGPFTLYESVPEGDGWSAPRRLPFSGAHDDQAPAFAPDGTRLFFQSRRPSDPANPPPPDAPRNDDVWVVSLDRGRWDDPRLVGPPISTVPPAGAEPFEGREMAPSMAAEGTLWFWSHRPGDSRGASDLYAAAPREGGWRRPANPGPAVNSEHYETHPWIAPDGSFLIFACDGCPDSRGASDLYVSRRVDGVWTDRVNLGSAVNSTAYDFGATLSPDGRRLLFSTNRPRVGTEPGRQDIRVVDVANVPALAFLAALPEIRYLANEGVLVRLPEGTVLIDGLFGDGLPEYPNVAPATRDSLERALGMFGEIDLVLVTHVHRDHFHAGAVERHLLANPHARLAASRQVVDSLRIRGTEFDAIRERVHAVDATPGKVTELEIAGIRVAAHAVAHASIDHLAFVVGDRTRVAHLGDMDFDSAGIETLSAAGPVSAVLAPYWLLTEHGGASRIAEALSARCLIGFHLDRGGAERALRRLAELAPGAILLAEPGRYSPTACAPA